MLTSTGAVPDVQGGEDADRREHARADVGGGETGPYRLSRGLTGDAHHAGHRLGHRTVAGRMRARPSLAISADRGIDKPRVSLGERIEAQAEPRSCTGSEVLDQDVRRASQPLHDRTALIALHVDAQAALVTVHREEVRRVLALKRRAPPPGVVAVPDVLDLDHIRAEIAEHHGGERSRQRPGQVKHAKTGKRPRRGRIIHPRYVIEVWEA